MVRERQRVELYSAGLPEVQTLEVSIDSAVLGAADAPSMVVSWGGRQTPPLSTLELGQSCRVGWAHIVYKAYGGEDALEFLPLQPELSTSRIEWSVPPSKILGLSKLK